MDNAYLTGMDNELIAMPVFEERISPLLDVSERFVIYEINNKRIVQRIVVSISDVPDITRIQKLKEIGVSVIISGAVSRHLSHIITESGVKHIPWANGPVDEIIKLYIEETLFTARPDSGSCGMQRKIYPGKNGQGRT